MWPLLHPACPSEAGPTAAAIDAMIGDEAVVVEGDAMQHRPDRELGRRLAAAFGDMPTATRWRFTGGPE
jgi:hypothetical protein